MIKVLFVCLGNICRSPMAEAVFRHKVKQAGLADLIEVDSAGTGDWHTGERPHEGTRRILKHNGVDDSGIRARQVRKLDFEHCRYIIAMDKSNVNDLTRWTPAEHQAEVKKLLDFVPKHNGGDVPDPYYTGNFQEVYDMVDEGCDRLLAYIREKEQV
ncbi:low molecular weight protein-tyrosine-phosphatase [Paenibacillus cremeus]|uniref:protein-tyrosine-phosphatase n=1 Tax=Paenibacillus cremeus TaxID=2163881 RepID=A0A559JKE3_9BACL|nr:low molecular weight protein-tyrosine-phosphatase [Paenibacillus cremeus]TVY00335.1 low molecular weight phosphotyrosine protein phosphatase [Paenibacillus cremeus]